MGSREAGVAWIGASNFVRCLSELGAWRDAERPRAPLLSISGHGRGYCGASILGSRWLGRELPAIPHAVRSVEALPGVDAILGDFGNDLAYGRSAEDVLGCVEEVLQSPWRRLVLVAPPLASVRRLSPRTFALAAVLLFPGRQVDRDWILEELEALDAGISEFATRERVARVTIPEEWIGADGIHLRRGCRRDFVWRVTGALIDGPDVDAPGPRGASSSAHPSSTHRWPPWWRRRPEHEAIWWFGRRTERSLRPSQGFDIRFV